MGNNVKITFSGLDEVVKAMTDVGPRQARNIMRATVQSIAGKIRDEAKPNAPKDKRGRIAKSMKAKRRKSPPDHPVSEVYFEVGKSAKNDGWFWRLHEYGTVKMSARPFVLPAKEKIDAKRNEIFTEEFGKKFEATMARAKK